MVVVHNPNPRFLITLDFCLQLGLIESVRNWRFEFVEAWVWMEIQTSGKPIDSLLEKVLCMNILSSDYFKELFRLKTYHEVVDEIYNQVDHVEPWMTGNCRGPSTAFCLLYKFFTMKLTVKQMHGLLKHKDSPYIRAVCIWSIIFVCCFRSESCRLPHGYGMCLNVGCFVGWVPVLKICWRPKDYLELGWTLYSRWWGNWSPFSCFYLLIVDGLIIFFFQI